MAWSAPTKIFGPVMVDSNVMTQSVPTASGPDLHVLPKGQVEIWTASLDVAPAIHPEFLTVLSADEIDRAGRFHFAIHRHRYVCARSFLRMVLSRYLDTAPQEIEFEYGVHGKPALVESFSREELHFNLSHSDGVGVLAVTREAPVGVDVEKVRELDEFDELVNRFFSPREAAKFFRLANSQKAAAFFNLWTRKEAWLKATGEGIAHRLKEVEVSFLAGEPARFLGLPEDKPESAGAKPHWQLYDFTPIPGYKAALAIAAPAIQIRSRSWVDSRASEAHLTLLTP